jgi:hypothetical protein
MKSRISKIAGQILILCLSVAWATSAHAQKVSVQEAIPNNGEQGTISLDVEINGRGFDNSAQVAFWVTGTTNPGGITVKGVTFIGSKKLIANIDIADDADIADFDIEVVLLSNGRKGKGTTLFSVKQKGGGNQTDACLTSTTFPAFAYWGQTGASQSNGLFLSDATGACIQQVSINGGPCLLGDMAAHYTPPASPGENGTGRVVSSCFAEGFIWEYTVGQDNSVTVTKDTILIASTSTPDDASVIASVDIAADGDTLAFGYVWADEDGDGTNDGGSLYTASLDGCLTETWQESDPTPCNGTSTEILSFPTIAEEGGARRFVGVAWRDDGKRIYLSQWFVDNTQGNGLMVADESSGVWSLFPVASADVLGDSPWHMRSSIATWDTRGDREVVAYRAPGDPDIPCDEVHIIDVEDCRADNAQCGSIGPVLLGSSPSFTNDGQLVFNLRELKGKRNCNDNQKIAIIDPFSPGSTPTEIVDGKDPEG